jgi:uncharacterized protein YbjT (DUF2867 family)
MITIMGASGHTGHTAADTLLRDGQRVRVIARAKDRIRDLVDHGAEAAIGDASDAAFLAGAFRGSEAVYALIPPDLGAQDYPARQDELGEAITKAVRDSGVRHVVFLSSIGAEQPAGTGPIAGLHRQEKRFEKISGLNVLFLRAGYFFENHLVALGLIKHQGVNGSAIAPDVAFPMVATRDIGTVAATALKTRDFRGAGARELLGPRDLTMKEATALIGAAIGRPDLAYMQFPYDAALEGMVGMGLTRSMASLYVEMSRGINEGRVRNLAPRDARSATSTRFEDFATKVIAPAYGAM